MTSSFKDIMRGSKAEETFGKSFAIVFSGKETFPVEGSSEYSSSNLAPHSLL